MNKKIIFYSLWLLLFQSFISSAFAVKAYPYPIAITQPDGSILTIRIKGDEFHHYHTTEDGYLIKKNSKGTFTYASKNAAGEIIESNMVAKNTNRRSAKEIEFLKTAPTSDATPESINNVQNSRMRAKQLSSPTKAQRAYPVTGSGKSLIILVNFSDVAFSSATPKADFNNMLNLPGYSANGGTGSARDYFMSSSNGKFTPNFIVVGPYTLPQTAAFYGTNLSNGNDQAAEQMVVDACKIAKDSLVDFTQFDTDNNGYVDNVFVYYAGHNEAEGASATTIWPHKSTLLDESTVIDGKIVYDYSCTSELKDVSGNNMCGIGTFCHEFGHVLGLPDYYNTSNVSKSTLNDWDIMDYGSYLNEGRTPPTYSAYDRFFLGYLTPQQISTPANMTLLPLYQGTTIPINTDNQAFLFSATSHNLVGNNPSPNEFFIAEYRKKTGWDSFLPKEGILIWHIDYNQAAWDNNTPNNYTGTTQSSSSHMRVYLQPLIGNTTTPGSAFTSGAFTPLKWDGTDINRGISDITKNTDSYTFNFMGAKTSATATLSNFTTTVYTPSSSQNITVNAANLTNNLVVEFTNNVHFEMKLSTSNIWSKSIVIEPTVGAATYTIQVRYNPDFNGVQNDVLNITSVGTTPISYILNGTSTLPINRPTVIVGKIDNLLQFPLTASNSTKTKVINVKTTDINNSLTIAISGTDANFFTVTATTIAKDIANGKIGQNITVSYHPTSAGIHSATLTISGGGLADKVIQLTGEGI